nr:tripartite tricarboxylate transporter TctB family protein [Sedimentibacter sp.]
MASKNEKTKPGEIGFSIILLCVGIGALIESIKMFLKDPTASSFGALPLFLSVVIVFFMLKIILFEDRKSGSENDNLSFKEKVKLSVNHAFTKDVLIVFFMLVCYCLMLFLNLGFNISTTIFLFVSMCYLMGGKYIKNIIFTVAIMAFILILFKTIFQVILP